MEKDINGRRRRGLRGTWVPLRRRRGLRGTWVPLFYHYTVTIALVSEHPINPGKSEGFV